MHLRDRVWAPKTGFQTHFQFHYSKVHLESGFYKPCTSGASESEFNHANRIACLKVGVPVYKVSRLPKCQGYLSFVFIEF